MRLLGQLFAALLVMGFVMAYIWWIVGAIVLVVLVRLAVEGYRQARTEMAAEARAVAARRQQLVGDADRQHNWWMVGDPRGIYGSLPDQPCAPSWARSRR